MIHHADGAYHFAHAGPCPSSDTTDATSMHQMPVLPESPDDFKCEWCRSFDRANAAQAE